MVNNILIEVLGTIAEQERLTIHQRQREGIDVAKAKGKHLGRPSTSLPDNWEEVLALWQAGQNHRTGGHAANRHETNDVLSACP